jgi:hypothetical protein
VHLPFVNVGERAHMFAQDSRAHPAREPVSPALEMRASRVAEMMGLDLPMSDFGR